MNGNEPITLAVLAGGAGARMGSPKSRLIINGIPVLQRILARLNWDGPTLLVTAPSTRNPPGAANFDNETSDPTDGNGPAQGLLTALNSSTTDRLVIIPVDMPMLNRDELKELIGLSKTDGVMCRRTLAGNELIEPFPGVFRKSLAPAIQELLTQNRRSLHGLLKLPQCTSVDVSHWPSDSWINLNTPEDLRRFEELQV